jgi:hypothetical protein
MHLFQDNGTAPADLSVVTKESASQGAAVRGADPAVGQYVAAYRAAADFTRAADIEARLAALFGEPFSVDRDAQIAALFERLAALDLRRAMRLAETPGFVSGLMIDVLRGLAESDPESALAALAEVRVPALQVELAVALVTTLGGDANALERIAAVLPESRRASLQVEALAVVATRDPQAAFDAAVALDDIGLRSAATQRVGVEWVSQDPRTAFAMSNNLPSNLREGYRNSVAAEWARLDSRDFLAFADTQGTLDEVLMGLMHTIAVDPEATFEVASNHPQLVVSDPIGAQFTIERTAFTAAAELDLQRYRAIIENMPPGQLKQRLGPAFIEMYARANPEEARAWARRQDDASYEARVIRNVAPTDYRLAYQWLKEYSEQTSYGNPAAIQNIVQFIGVFAATDENRAAFATALLRESDDPSAEAVRTAMLGNWVQSEPGSALDWMLENGAAIEPALASSIASALAVRDAKKAAQYIDRLPAEIRPNWMQQVATPYASQNPSEAATWLAQFQGQPGYDSAYRAVMNRLAQADPLAAAQMLSAAPGELQASLSVSMVANGFAREDLAGAARWASSLSDTNARAQAVGQVASDWAARDPRSAQRWALGFPRGELRDQALSSVLSRMAQSGFAETIDPELLEAFASESSRERARQMVERGRNQFD